MRKINTNDVFKMSRIIKKANIKEELAEAFRKGKAEEADVESIGIDVFLSIIEAAGDEGIEGSVYDLLGGITEIQPKKIGEQTIETTIQQLKEISKENNLISFFKFANHLTK